jgi:hypothetical protein
MEPVTANGHRRIPAGREQRWTLASTTCRRISGNLGVKDLTAYWKEASPMSNRDFGCTALGRFLAVERYVETCQPSSTDPQRSPRADRAGRYADTPDSRSGLRPPARPRHG